MISKAIQLHIENIFLQLSKIHYEPNFQIQHQITSLLKLSSESKENIQNTLKNLQVLKKQISEEEIFKYHFLTETINKNTITIQILKLANNVIKQIEEFKKFLQSMTKENQLLLSQLSAEQNDEKLKHQYNIFSILLTKIKFFDDYLNKNLLELQNNKQLSFEHLKQLKQKFYREIWQRIIENQQIKKKTIQIVSACCNKYKLPLSRNQIFNKNDNHQKKINKYHLIQLHRILNTQTCYYTLSVYLNNLLQVDGYFNFTSLFFNTYFAKLNKTSGESHNIQQPAWMFQYIYEFFRNNYIYLRDSLMENVNQQIKTNLMMFTLQYNSEHLFLENIKARLESDISSMTGSTTNLKQRQFQSFLCFNFLDQLSKLQEQLNITFSQQFGFIQSILNTFVLYHKSNMLQLNFDYQHKWIEQKIFEDFYNINYSKIDLKNIEAYNIVVNYCVLFQKLYSKFKDISNELLTQKVLSFYHESILNLIAHIKSSFEKIYQNSGLKKIDVILAFKRVQSQFKAGLSGFISQSIDFQTKIKSQYYGFLQNYFNLYALQQLSPLHRKLIRLINQNQKFFSNVFTQTEKLSLKDKNNLILADWRQKVSQLNSLYPYTDIKVKSMFFTFLESTQFSQQGITIFLQVFQSYLKIIYSIQGFSIIKMIAIMQKTEIQQYIAVYGNRLTFLNQSQIKCIKNVRIKFF